METEAQRRAACTLGEKTVGREELWRYMALRTHPETPERTASLQGYARALRAEAEAVDAYVATLKEAEWILPGDCDGDFYEVKAAFCVLLDEEQIRRASGCIGYALRETLAGEDLSEPTVMRETEKGFPTVLTYSYDATKSQRDDPDYGEAFNKAAQYVHDGTPIRKTNRAGANTRGTRLVEGIGFTAHLYVR
jgi:hypothetical protein